MADSHIQIDDRKFFIKGKFVRVGKLEDEWYEDVTDPESLIEGLRKSEHCPDVLCFWQRLPDVTPRFEYQMERDPVAAIPIQSYSHWWDKQIDAKTRNMVRRAEKKGVVVRQTDFDDKFVEGMTSIFNETPVRQGKRFWHYGKSFDTLKRDFSRFLFREEVFGAYLGEELIGFIMLAYAGRYAALGQIISKIAHRDKSPNNVLIARAVQRCAEKGIAHLAYAKWVDGTLGMFKVSNGFQKFDLPRYFVPLTAKGKLYVSLKLYRGISGLMPSRMARWARNARRRVMESPIKRAVGWVTRTRRSVPAEQ